MAIGVKSLFQTFLQLQGSKDDVYRRIEHTLMRFRRSSPKALEKQTADHGAEAFTRLYPWSRNATRTSPSAELRFALGQDGLDAF